MPVLHNILVANRGEIALRVMRSARALGYRTTAVYSDADRDAPHVAFADRAVRLGPAPVAESYLNAERVLAAAQTSGADAVHPGYGFLSENAAFARACAGAGLTFIGPSAEAIELMGDKRRARIAVQAQGVPCVPGYDGEAQDDATLLREAERVGFPIMVKAAAGGGGRGMRRVTAAGELADAIARARSEAQHAFGDGRLILERAIDGARHVEVQILADRHGHTLHLGERDCSLQRRFQKVIEEAPSPAVDAALRARMGELAVRAARSARYLGAGTVELLLAPGGEVYFLEMNTRLQVEHPVTELVTGLDLVALQLQIAEGEALPLRQEDLQLSGHAIEARLYAEDPARGYLPATGQVHALVLPDPELVRFDHALAPGLTVSAHYDPMLGKLIAHGADREQARRKLLRALEQLRVLGVQTNQTFLRDVLEQPAFVSGSATTDFLDRSFDATAAACAPPAQALAAAALLFAARSAGSGTGSSELAGYSNCAALRFPLRLELRGEPLELALEPAGGRAFIVHIGEQRVPAELVELAGDAARVQLDGALQRIDYAFAADGELFVHAAGTSFAVRDVTHAAVLAAARAGAGSGRALAPMDGAVVDVAVQVGDAVVRGQTLAVIEAMKLELKVTADRDGVVAAVHVERGQQVKARQLLVELAVASEP